MLHYVQTVGISFVMGSIVPFDYKEQDAAQKNAEKFTEGTVWRLSKVVLATEDTRWVGSPKKLVVVMNRSVMAKTEDPKEMEQVAVAVMQLQCI